VAGREEYLTGNELIYSDATKLAGLIRTREVSPVEIIKAHLDRIEALNPRVNAVVTIVEDALESAKKAEAAVQRGDEMGPLHGVPFTVGARDCHRIRSDARAPIARTKCGPKRPWSDMPGWFHPGQTRFRVVRAEGIEPSRPCGLRIFVPLRLSPTRQRRVRGLDYTFTIPVRV
jgi:hypothetical protein